jgi:hypothetical protein
VCHSTFSPLPFFAVYNSWQKPISGAAGTQLTIISRSLFAVLLQHIIQDVASFGSAFQADSLFSATAPFCRLAKKT